MAHQRQACRGPGAGGAAADHPRMHIGGRTRAVEVIGHLLHLPHEVQEGQWPHIAQGVVGEAALGLNRLDDLVGTLGEPALLVAVEMKAELTGIHQGIEAAAVGHAVGHLAQPRHLDRGTIGIDIAGQPLAGDRLHHAVLHSRLDPDRSRRRLEREALHALPLGHDAGLEYRGGGADGVGARVDGITHHLHDDIAGGRLGVTGRNDQVHRHLGHAIGFEQQQLAQAIGIIAQVVHLLAYRGAGQGVDAAQHDPTDITAGVGVHHPEAERTGHGRDSCWEEGAARAKGAPCTSHWRSGTITTLPRKLLPRLTK